MSQRPLLLKSVSVIRPFATPVVADVLVTDGILSDISPNIIPPEGTVTLNALGKVLLPGLFDTQAHLREPGREDSETIASGCEAAARGGFTGLVAMPDTTPAIDNGGMVQSVLDLASKSPVGLQVFTAGCITKGRRGEELAEFGEMVQRGAVMVTDDPDAVSNSLIMRRAFQYARDLGLLVATHCDSQEISGAGCFNDGRVSYRLGLPGIPSCAEEICLARDIRLAQSVRGRVHVNRLTTQRSVETVARYQMESQRAGTAPFVSAAVTPHHLIFCEDDMVDGAGNLAYDTNFKVKPPYRTASDRTALRQALREGVLSVIATDHSPFTEFEKECEFSRAPFGVTGLVTALPALHHHLILKQELDWQTLVQRFCTAPRQLLGLPRERLAIPTLSAGETANFVLFDPVGTTQVTRNLLGELSFNSPFLGKALTGRVDLVMLGKNFLCNALNFSLT